MVRIAKSDGFAFEPVGVVPGDDTVVRREVKAGGVVPDNWQLEGVDTEEAGESGMTAGLGAAPHAYPHQIDEQGKVKEEHLEDVDLESTRPSARAAKATGRGRKPDQPRSEGAPGQAKKPESKPE